MANGNMGPAEQLYRSVRRDVEQVRAGRGGPARPAALVPPKAGGGKAVASRSRSKPRANRDASSSRAPSKPRASSRDGGSRSSGRNGLSSRTPAQRAAFAKMIAARANGSSRGASRGPSRGAPPRPRVGRDDSLQWRGNPDRQRINVNEKWERAYWSRTLGVSVQDLVETVRRLGGTPTVDRVRNALLGRDRARSAQRGPSRARPAPRGSRDHARRGARGGRPLGGSGFVIR